MRGKKRQDKSSQSKARQSKARQRKTKREIIEEIVRKKSSNKEIQGQRIFDQISYKIKRTMLKIKSLYLQKAIMKTKYKS